VPSRERRRLQNTACTPFCVFLDSQVPSAALLIDEHEQFATVYVEPGQRSTTNSVTVTFCGCLLWPFGLCGPLATSLQC